MNYFTADSHFSYNDESVLSRDYRPFKSLQEMNKKIIDIWNSQAGEDDVIYHLGDFVNYNYLDISGFEERLGFVKKIKAKVVLILGNNEKRIMRNDFGGNFEKFRQYLLGFGFFEVYETYYKVKIGENEYLLTHEPKDCDKSNIYNLFAHIHKNVFIKKYGINVGVDNHYFKLFSEKDILDIQNNRSRLDENVFD